MFHVWYEIIDLCILQVGQLSKNAGLFVYFNRLWGEKRFVSVVSDVLVALYKYCITAAL